MTLYSHQCVTETEYFTLPHMLPQTPWGLSISLHGVHEDFVETPWILAGIHSSPPLPYSEVMECGGVVFIRALTDGPYTRSRKKPIGGETHLEN